MGPAETSVAREASATRPFLTANWRNLVMVNYEVPPDVLKPWVPAGVELDTWEGKTLASIVAFEFLDTRVLGMAISGHRNFHEVNLRFYVRRRVDEGFRRGVVFVKELVPRRTIACVARWLYGERYKAARMNGRVWHGRCGQDLPDWTTFIRYWWRVGRSYEGVYAEASGEPTLVMEGTEAAFITDHAWGYSVCRGKTLEYQVKHPPWRVWDLSHVVLDCDVGRLYGERFAPYLQEPCSAFVAEGSPVVVRWGRRLEAAG